MRESVTFQLRHGLSNQATISEECLVICILQGSGPSRQVTLILDSGGLKYNSAQCGLWFSRLYLST